MSTSTSNLCQRQYKVKTNGIVDVISSDSDDDRTVKHGERFRSNSVDRFRRRAEEVWTVSTREEKEDEPQNLIPEYKREPEEKVGDIVHLGRTSYFIIDIFEKEIMELGDKVDLNFKRFNKFEAVYGDAPRDHHFYNYRCCYSSCCCVCSSTSLETLWGILMRKLASREKEDGSKGVSFFVRTYEERKELMRVVATVRNGDNQSHSLFFFDLKFPKEYPYQPPSFFYHPYGLPLASLETHKQIRPKLCYNIFDVFLHIEDIVLMNTNKSCQQMLDMLRWPLEGFEDFVKGHFRYKAPLILQNMMEEMDMENKKDKNMFWKMYIAFEDNKAYCEHLLNSDLREELKRFKEKEHSLSDRYYSYPSVPYFPTVISRFDDTQKTSKFLSFWSKFLLF